MASLSEETKKNLTSQLVKLGDMLGDGLQHEPGGKWISREYNKICRALGLTPARPRANNSQLINEHMAKRITEVVCRECSGHLKQTRSGSMRAKCEACGAVFRLLTVSRRKKGRTS
ncbi:hypothetical protein [Enterobacter soli]|uniref:hypothetical protein n=1 Tax=Enterobacter soli TaxID=885040 RepID=UPI002F414135